MESVKSLPKNGAVPKKHGAYGITPLDIATVQEHEAVVQMLLAAGAGPQSRVKGVEDEDEENSAKVEPSSPQLESAPGGKPEFSQEFFDNAEEANRGSEIPGPQDPQIQRATDTQPADSSTDIDSTAQQQPQSSSPDSTFPYSRTSQRP